MKAKLHARIGGLEQTYRAAIRSLPDVEHGPSVSEKVRGLLQAHGIQQEAHESLADTTARALGINSRQLRTILSEIAAGRRDQLDLSCLQEED
jgi:hypothetical protein